MLLVFKKEQTINLHTFFVFSPLDIYFLDKNKRVISLQKHVKQWRFTSGYGQYALEIPAGSSPLKLGEKVIFKNAP